MPEDLYCWQEQEPNGRWGNITAIVPFLPQLGATLLVARDRAGMEQLRPIAEQHHQRTGRRVRFARYSYAATIDEIPPSRGERR